MLNELDEPHLKKQLNYFPSVNGSKNVVYYKSLQEVFNIIQTGADGNKDRIDCIRRKIKIVPYYIISEEYQKDKERLPGIVHHATFRNYLIGNNLKEFTGLMLLDFDGLSEDQIRQLIEILQNLPYIISAYPSLSETGVHAIINISGIKNKSDYTRCFRQLTMFFKNKYGFILCQGTGKICQLEILPYYPQLKINYRVIPYDYSFDQITENEYGLNFAIKKNAVQIDTDAWKFEAELYEEKLNYYNVKFGRSYYAGLIMIDKLTRLPVPTGSSFDNGIHRFTRYFDEEIISQFDKHNYGCTMAILPEKVAGIKIHLYEKRRFVHKHRANQIIAIMMQYGFISLMNGTKKELVDFYSLSQVLNQRCVSKSENNLVYYPLTQSELKSISAMVYNAYKENTIIPSLVERRVIINEKLYKKNENKTSTFMIEYNKLKWGNTRIDNHTAIHEMKNKVLLQKPGVKKAELVKIICEDGKYKSNTVYNALRSEDTKLFAIQEASNTLQMNKNVSPKIKTTFERIKEEIECLLTYNQIITKGLVADMVGVSTMTIQRNWAPFKAIIEKHNLEMKQIDNALLTGLNQIKDITQQGRDIEPESIKEKNKIIKINPEQPDKLTAHPVHQKDSGNNFEGVLAGKHAS
jgi:hypothetical protein